MVKMANNRGEVTSTQYRKRPHVLDKVSHKYKGGGQKT